MYLKDYDKLYKTERNQLIQKFIDKHKKNYLSLQKSSHECSAICFSDELKTIEHSYKCEENCFKPFTSVINQYKEYMGFCQQVFNNKGKTCYIEIRPTEKRRCEEELLKSFRNCLKIQNKKISKKYDQQFQKLSDIYSN